MMNKFIPSPVDQTCSHLNWCILSPSDHHRRCRIWSTSHRAEARPTASPPNSSSFNHRNRFTWSTPLRAGFSCPPPSQLIGHFPTSQRPKGAGSTHRQPSFHVERLLVTCGFGSCDAVSSCSTWSSATRSEPARHAGEFTRVEKMDLLLTSNSFVKGWTIVVFWHRSTLE